MLYLYQCKLHQLLLWNVTIRGNRQAYLIRTNFKQFFNLISSCQINLEIFGSSNENRHWISFTFSAGSPLTTFMGHYFYLYRTFQCQRRLKDPIFSCNNSMLLLNFWYIIEIDRIAILTKCLAMYSELTAWFSFNFRNWADRRN